MKKVILVAALCLSACTAPDASGVKVIVGAKLVNPGREPVEYSVVVIEGGKITAAGPQSQVPVPKGSAITKGLGMTIEPEPGGESIEPGHPANLILKGPIERKMHLGEWVS